MDLNNWPLLQGNDQPPRSIDGGYWRSQLQPDFRQNIVNKIMETLNRHVSFSDQEGLQEVKQIAIRFEEQIYSASTSQSDYLRNISFKMLTLESTYQNKLPNAMPSNFTGVSRNPQDADSNNWQLPHGDAQPPPSIDGGDWRSQLQTGSRQRIVNKIMETLNRHLSFFDKKGLQELKQIAVRFEEKIYSVSTSQSDYLWDISFKMLTLESIYQNKLPDFMPSNFTGVSRNLKDQDSNNWQLPQGDARPPPSIDGVDWRSQLQPNSRQTIINKIMETLKRHLPFSGQEGLQELKQIAIIFEEKIYSAATSQSDYLRKISLEMLSMESNDKKHFLMLCLPTLPV